MTTARVDKELFEADGAQAWLWRCTNAHGHSFAATDYGAHLVEVQMPDREAARGNVTLGFSGLSDYLGPHPYFGATIGRYGNRIAQGRFAIDGQSYELPCNRPPNHLHGGVHGFNRHLWRSEPVQTEYATGVRFTRTSPEGEEGYPGTLDVEVSLVLNNDNELIFDYRAQTDRPTVINLTNHSYWNLGAGKGSADTVRGHELTMAAAQYLAVDEALIPTEPTDVLDTPFDFREGRRIGEQIDAVAKDLGGYDHCLVLTPADGLRFAARLIDPDSGRSMEVWTTQPGVQLYTGNNLDGSAAVGGFGRHAGVCLETQHFPNSPNRPDFPCTELRPGDVYHHATVHRFGVTT